MVYEIVIQFSLTLLQNVSFPWLRIKFPDFFPDLEEFCFSLTISWPVATLPSPTKSFPVSLPPPPPPLEMLGFKIIVTTACSSKEVLWNSTALHVINCTHLQNIPAKLYAIILGQKWFKTEWKPSRQLVWESGDACLIPLINLELVSAAYTFSYTGESAINQPKGVRFG